MMSEAAVETKPSNGTETVAKKDDEPTETKKMKKTDEEPMEEEKKEEENAEKGEQSTKETKEDEKLTKETKDDDKSEEKNVEATQLELKIIKQVEYYFGDINLARDKFLQGQIKEDDGWVALDTMIKFNRLKQLSEDTNIIAQALKKSSSGLIQVHKENSKIRRNPDKKLPEFNKERKDDLKARSIYAKPFPLDLTLDNLQLYFSKYGVVEHIQMRRDIDKKFKGSVFVLFENKESVKKFLAEENTKYKEDDTDVMTKMLKDEYWKMKGEEKKQVREKELKDKEEAKKEQEEKEEEDFKSKMTKGAILVLNDMPRDLNRDKIKEHFSKIGNCAWVDWDSETGEARLRFDKEGSAKEALKKAEEAGEGKVKVADKEVKSRVLDGEEEEEHWKKMFQDMRAKRNKDRAKFSGKRHRGGRHGGPPKKRARSGDD